MTLSSISASSLYYITSTFTHLEICIFSNDDLSFIICVERVHEDQWYIGIIHFIETLHKEMLIFVSDKNKKTQSSVTSICCTVRSRKVRSLRTGMTDLGPWQPIEVPRPPLSLMTTNLSSMLLMDSVGGVGRDA